MTEHFFKDITYFRTNEFKNDRLTLVFVHGVSGSSSAWIPYEKIFENKYNVLVYDIRGHGKSKKFPHYADYEIPKFANDLHDLISYLNINKFILVSHSFAILIALEYIKSWRSTVAAAVFLSPIIYMNENFSSKIMRPIMKLTAILNVLPFDPTPRGHIDYTKHPNTTDWNIRRNIADMRNTTPRIHFYCLRQSLIKKQEYFLEKIKVPTLIVHGKNDTMAKVANSVAMSKKIENSEITIIPDTDHIVVLNNTKEISTLIESFIEKNRLNLLKNL